MRKEQTMNPKIIKLREEHAKNKAGNDDTNVEMKYTWKTEDKDI